MKIINFQLFGKQGFPKKVILLLILVILAISIYAEDMFPGPPTGSGVGDSPWGTLDIISVKVSPSKPEPGEEVTVKVEVENNADEDIEDIEITVDFDGLEDDNEDEIEDDKNFDLRKGRDDTIKFNFKMPYNVDDRDSYDVNINIEGEGEDSGKKYTASNSEKKITFDKKSHELLIKTLDISPSVLRCSDDVRIDYEIMNIGKNDEDVEISITNYELGIDYETSIELDEEDKHSDSVRLSPKLIQGIHEIELRVEYRNNVKSESVELSIEECKKETKITKQKQEKKQAEEEKQKEEEKRVITKIYSPVKSTTPATQATATKLVKRSRVKFAETDEYLMLLAILFIILLGAVIYAVGAAIILSKR